MNSTILLDLDQTKKRLDYYTQRKNEYGTASKKATPVDRWIEIYSERLKKLERQAAKLGLPTKH